MNIKIIIWTILLGILCSCQPETKKLVVMGDYSNYAGIDTTKTVTIDSYQLDLDLSGSEDSIILGNLKDLIGDPQLFTFLKLITEYQTVEIKNVGGFKIDPNSIIGYENQIESDFIFIAKTKTEKTLAFIWDYQYPDCTNKFEIYSIGQNEILKLFSENLIVEEITDSEIGNKLILSTSSNCDNEMMEIEITY